MYYTSIATEWFTYLFFNPEDRVRVKYSNRCLVIELKDNFVVQGVYLTLVDASPNSSYLVQVAYAVGFNFSAAANWGLWDDNKILSSVKDHCQDSALGNEQVAYH